EKPSLTIQRAGWTSALRNHWPEYLSEAAALGTFMVSACAVGVLLNHPSSAVYQALVNSDVFRRAIGRLAMGATPLPIIHTRWGKRSGAHMNPAVTLTFWTLGKIATWDAVFYILCQFLGGIAGVVLAALLIGEPLQHAAVNYAATTPGSGGLGVAFAAEFF